MSADGTHERIIRGLERATDTRVVRIGDGVVCEVPRILRALFRHTAAVVVADADTYRAAGQRVTEAMRDAGLELRKPIVFDETDLHAEYRHVERLRQSLGQYEAVPIAVGSGTINDLTKLAAHLCGRPYMVVATAASMDGYTASGASIKHRGAKQTMACRAPRAVVADMDIICDAPPELNAAGYADLLAKVVAGADWLVADALGVDPIDPSLWTMVQGPLREWVARPERIRRGDRAAVRGLLEGLMMTGFAIQSSGSTRPVSGAEHQFSHLWDMQDHRHQGRIPLHGHKVGIGTLACALLYEQLLAAPIDTLDAERLCNTWPDFDRLEREILDTHARPELRTLAVGESRAKYPPRERLAALLNRLKDRWPVLRTRLADQLIPARTLRTMLQDAGAPGDPREIGIDLPRLRRSYIEAQQIRSRFTGLDLAAWTGLMEECLDSIFAPTGLWGESTP